MNALPVVYSETQPKELSIATPIGSDFSVARYTFVEFANANNEAELFDLVAAVRSLAFGETYVLKSDGRVYCLITVLA